MVGTNLLRVSFLHFLRSKVDNLLEILLDQEKYDFRIRPNYDGEPIKIPSTIVFFCFIRGPRSQVPAGINGM